MKPLNAFLYLRNNFKKVLPIFLSLLAGVFMIYFYSLFSATTEKMMSVASTDLMDKYNIVYTNDDSLLPLDFKERLNNTKGADPIPVQMNLPGFAYYRGGMGGTTILTFNLFSDDVSALLKTCGVQLVSGSLPENNQAELLIPREYALQNNLEIGDYVGTEVSDEYMLYGKYRICGFTQGDVIFTVTCQPGEETKEQMISRSLMYKSQPLSGETKEWLLKDLPANVVTRTRSYYEEEYSATLLSMQSLTYVLTAAMVLVLCIALGNLNAVLIANRKNEMRILHFIGYTSGYLSRKIWLENLLVCVCGFFAGIGFTTVVVWMVNIFIMQPNGKCLEGMNWRGMAAACMIPVFVSIFSVLPGMKQISSFTRGSTYKRKFKPQTWHTNKSGKTYLKKQM